MANNNIKVKVDVDYTEMTGLINTTGQTKQALKLVSQQFSKTGNQKAYMTGINRIVSAQNKLDKSARMSRSEIMKLGTEIKQSAQFANALAKASSTAATQAGQMGRRMSRTGVMTQQAKESRETQRAAEQEAQALHRLKMSTDASYASIYKLQSAKRVLKKEVREGRMTLEQYVASMRKVVQANNAVGASTATASKYMSRGGVAMQQFGYQAGDFIVQVQSGQNAMVAFGQQATQMVGALYMLPPAVLAGRVAILGLSASVGLLIASLGIIVPLATAVGAAFMRTRGSSDEAEKGVKSLTSALNASARAARDSLTPVKELTEEYGRFAEAVRESSRLAAQAQVTKALDSLGVATESTRESLITFRRDFEVYLDKQVQAVELAQVLGEETVRNASQFREVNDSVQRAANAMSESAAVMGLTSSEASRLYTALNELEGAGGPDSIAQSAQNTLDTIRRIFPETEKIPPEIAEMVVQLDEVLKAAAASAKVMQDMADTDIASGISDAADEAQRLAEKLGLSLQAAQSIIRIQSALSDGSTIPSGPFGGAITTPESTRFTPRVLTRSEVDARDKEDSGGGGVSGADALETLMKRIALDEQLLGVSQERAQVMRALASSEREYSASAIEGAIKRLEAYNQEKERIAEIQGIYNTAQSSLEDGFMAMVDGTKTVEDAFKDMARSIIKELYDVLVVQQMVGRFDRSSGTGSGIMGFIGNALKSFDGGGYTGSGPRSGGMDGRGGYLAMLHPRETVVDHTKAGSSSGGGVTVVQNFNFQANGDDSVKKLIAQAAPQIANMAKQSVVDSRRRGGAMKNAFG